MCKLQMVSPSGKPRRASADAKGLHPHESWSFTNDDHVGDHLADHWLHANAGLAADTMAVSMTAVW